MDEMDGSEPLLDESERWRAKMIWDQLRRRGISDRGVLDAFSKIPRHRFCQDVPLEIAYGDHPVDIGHDQTISQPFMVAHMMQEARLRSEDRLLEVGTGSGYQTALLALLVERVLTVECIPELLASARRQLRELGIRNVEFLAGDGSIGWPERAPFDVILYTAGAPVVPEFVQRQLKVGGRLLAPVGGRKRQMLVRIERTAEETFRREEISPCSFVPLRGAYGWAD